MRICRTVKAGIVLSFLGGAVLAERVDCVFSVPCLDSLCIPGTVPVSFKIDRNQFAPAVHADEPPRNKVTRVAMGETEFPAEPILMGDGTRGFWANVAGVEHLMTARPDGLATYASTGTHRFMSGTCEVHK